jgi:acetyl-CoA acetyltransferase
VDDVALGESLHGGGDIGRYAAIEAGLVNAPGIAHNRHCASGLAAVQSAAALVLTGRDVAAEHGLEPLAVVRAWASAGVPPADTGLAPALAIPKALARAGLSARDVGLWEINEAFASVPVAATRALGLDLEVPSAAE